MAACSSSSLREVRAREPELRFAGVPASGQFEVARCIRDMLDQSIGEDILQEIEMASDGIHVVGRLAESLSAGVFYDVAVKEDAILARAAPGSVIPPEMLRRAIGACHSAVPGAAG
ncbi:MAG TPA: hypothetical protein VLK35_14255 [Methylomirabilota bacterium]|nr:hypothetical protein [Methylomirabilota bacterium]